MVNSRTTYSVSIGKLALSMVLRNIYNKIETMVGNHLHNIILGIGVFVGPHYRCRLNTVLVEELGWTHSSIDIISLLCKYRSRIEQVYLRLCCTRRHHHILFGNIVSYSNHCIQESLFKVVANATNLTC